MQRRPPPLDHATVSQRPSPLWLTFLVLLWASCTGAVTTDATETGAAVSGAVTASEGTTSSGETADGSATTEIPTDAEVGTYVGNGTSQPTSGTTEVGTYVGNGTSTIKTLLTFKTTSSSSASTTASETSASLAEDETLTAAETAIETNSVSDSASEEVAETNSVTEESTVTANEEDSAWPYERCYAKNTDGSPGAETQRCLVTPEHYDMGVRKISLMKCFSGTEVVPCVFGEYDASETYVLYDGEQVNVNVDDGGSEFGETLGEITADFTAGGIIIETAYVQQMFPVTGNAESERVAEHLKGKNYRLCTDAENGDCGNDQAQSGDLLVDGDGDGTLGFLDLLHTTADSLGEGVKRSASYGAPDYAAQYMVSSNKLSEIVVAFDSVVTFAPGFSYDIAVSFDISDTMIFTDGNAAARDHDVCAQGIAAYLCVNGDDDPYSIAVYNPYYDAGLVPVPPHPSATATPVEE